MRSRKIIRELVQKLHSDSIESRWNAAAELVSYPDSDAVVSAILESLPGMDWSVKHIALWIVGELRHEAALPTLIAALEDDSLHVRLSAARALEKFDAEEAKIALEKWKGEETSTN